MRPGVGTIRHDAVAAGWIAAAWTAGPNRAAASAAVATSAPGGRRWPRDRWRTKRRADRRQADAMCLPRVSRAVRKKLITDVSVDDRGRPTSRGQPCRTAVDGAVAPR